MIREVTDTDLISGGVGLYDWLMILFLIVVIVAGFAIILWILALPGKIALARNHPHAETVKIMGWAGALPLFPWIHAFIWAFHDSVTVDIRRFPKEEREAIEREIARLKGDEAPQRVEVQRVPATPPQADS
jgi:Protein of unknown function (DUF3302)